MTQGDSSPPPTEAKQCKICGQRFTNDACFCPFDGEPLVDVATWESSRDPRIDTVVDGRYEVTEALGEGGMGTVYRVKHRVLKRNFAMKVLRREVAMDRDLCARFIQEARTAATINHPNVVQINDYGQLPDGTPYFVMELLKGLPLSKLIKRGGPIPAARAVRMLRQIAEGVGAAHRAGIVHRDLKPDNVFVIEAEGEHEQVRILDFGVAKIAGSASITRTGMVFGSPHYMSPEQASGQPVDHRADIYAFGVIMYEMFTGRVPFEADTFMGVLTKHMFMVPEPFEIKDTDTRSLGALEDITLRCLQKKPENRFPTMEALVAEVDDVVELGAGDDFDVRPSKSNSAHRPAMSSFRLADELEPPRAAEVTARRALRTLPPRGSYGRAGVIVFTAGVALFAAAIAWLVERSFFEDRVSPAHGALAGSPAWSLPPAAVSSSPSVAAPAAPPPSASAPTQVASAPVWDKPPSTPRPPQTGAATRPPKPNPPTTSSGEKSSTVSPEIIDPWKSR